MYNYWSEPTYENGVEVNYSSNCSIYMADTNTGEYTEKFDVFGDHAEHYTSHDSYWDSHTHTHYDSDGNGYECHGMEDRPWYDRDRD